MIDESSLSRVWHHFENKDTVVILTAFRGDKKYSENLKNNMDIAQKIKSAGFGYFFVDGYWIENKGNSDERKVHEDSIFCISEPARSEELIKLTHKLANDYNQDAIFVKTADDVYLYYNNSEKEHLSGGLKLGKIGDFYTKLRNNKKANTFVFEGARTSYGFFASWAISLVKS